MRYPQYKNMRGITIIVPYTLKKGAVESGQGREPWILSTEAAGATEEGISEVGLEGQVGVRQHSREAGGPGSGKGTRLPPALGFLLFESGGVKPLCSVCRYPS